MFLYSICHAPAASFCFNHIHTPLSDGINIFHVIDLQLYITHQWSLYPSHIYNKQRFLTPGHQGWNDLHSLCRIGMEYYLLNNDDNNIIYWIMMIIMIMMTMIIIMIIMMTMMIIGTATIMIMIIIITTTLTMTIMKMIMIKTAQTPFSCLRLRQWPVTYLITLSDWIMSCQPSHHAVVTVCEPDWKHKWAAYKSFDETSSFNNL